MQTKQAMTAADAPSTKLYKISNIATAKDKINKWLIPGWAPLYGTSMFFGKSRAGKSTLSRQLAVAVAQGGTFLGRQVAKGKAILLYQEENPAFLQECFSKLGLKDEDDLLATCEPLEDNALARIEKILMDNAGLTLLILDTFAAAFDVDPNEHKLVNPILKRIARLAKKHKTHILIIHHSNKATRSDARDNASGSGAFTQNCDFPLELQDDANEIRWITARPRYGKAVPKTALTYDDAIQRFELGKKEAAIAEEKKESNELRVEREILESLAVSQNMTAAELRGSVKADNEVYYRHLKHLVTVGSINKTPARPSKPSIYSLAQPEDLKSGSNEAEIEAANRFLENVDVNEGLRQ